MKSKVILITGTSSGFGQLIAARLAKFHKVYATMRAPETGSSALKQAVGTHAGKLTILPLDVTDTKSIVAVIQKITQQEGHLDVLINNAGYGLGGFFEDLTEAEIREQMETNFFGVQKVTREALPLMRASDGNRKIINISSIAGLTGTPCLSAYNASKWALEGFSESLYYELHPFGIDVVLVEPGQFKTKIFTENVRLAKFMKHKESPYYHYSMKALDLLNKNVQKLTAKPDTVASLVEKIVNDPSPKFRYLVGKDAKLRLYLKRLLPFKVYANLILKRLK